METKLATKESKNKMARFGASVLFTNDPVDRIGMNFSLPQRLNIPR
jgi:hypothetical protein